LKILSQEIEYNFFLNQMVGSNDINMIMKLKMMGG
jgi:hypothetical protein